MCYCYYVRLVCSDTCSAQLFKVDESYLLNCYIEEPASSVVIVVDSRCNI